MTREELNSNFAMHIEKERTQLGYTQSQMAKALEMSLSSYKNMISGVSVNIPIYVAYLMHELTGKFFIELCGDISPELKVMKNFRSLPKHRQEAIQTIVDIECQLAEYGQYNNASEHPQVKEDDIISVYIPTGNMEDGMIFDSLNIEPLNIHHYRKIFGDLIDCGIKITSNHLHPAYHTNDILLISRRPPRDGDTGIFINRETCRIYIRKFRQTSPCRLEPITGYGKTITVDSYNPGDMEKWIKFGYIITKIR